MGDQVVITKAGELVDHITEAAMKHGCRPTTEVIVRIGTIGAQYRINCLKGQSDDRGTRLVIELCPVPEDS
jgi:hypothetical protein